MTTTKICSRCSVAQELVSFYSDKRTRDGLTPHCKSCHAISVKTWQDANSAKHKANCIAWKRANPERAYSIWKKYADKNVATRDRIQFKASIKRLYGISVEEYGRLLESQSFVCAICFESPHGRDLDVDHDHETGQVRGLLCHKCNRALGLLNDNPDRARAAAAYVESGRSVTLDRVCQP